MAGDEVKGENGFLYVNGSLMKESYTDTRIGDGDFGPIRIEQDMVFVMGDNRHARSSSDSRVFGAVAVSMIEGRAEWILWPYASLARL
ncbi:signal peptidase I [Paenibacillus hexagrammi]|uniref:signal peptidase I n=1 Tax=Paenibacillus hexagrammi TaxID=2908839 RepID=UPI0021A34AA3|nr:signal peptidase I [Paenibacillus sp. YPD9-1]